MASKSGGPPVAEPRKLLKIVLVAGRRNRSLARGAILPGDSEPASRRESALDKLSGDAVGTPSQLPDGLPSKIRVSDTLKQNDFAERRDAAAAAKKRLIEKMQQAPKHDDPAQVEKRAAKVELKAATALQRTERHRLTQEAEATKQGDEEAAALAAAEAEKAQSAAAAERAMALKEQQKAKRDRRYAARKSRK